MSGETGINRLRTAGSRQCEQLPYHRLLFDLNLLQGLPSLTKRL
jgi:hypothetical protein